MEHSGLCLMNSEVRFFCKQGSCLYNCSFCFAKCLLENTQTCELHPLDAGCAIASLKEKTPRHLSFARKIPGCPQKPSYAFFTSNA